MEIFPKILTKPFIIAKAGFIKNKGNAQLDGALKSKHVHSLAYKIDQKQEEDNKEYTVNKSKLQKLIDEAVKNSKKQCRE